MAAIRALDFQMPVVEVASTRPQDTCDSQVVLEFYADGRLDINKQWVLRPGLESSLRQIYANRSSCSVIYIAAAPTVRYRVVADLVDRAKAAGIRQIVMITPDYSDSFALTQY